MKDFLHHLLIPRESNKYRSKLLHYEVLFLLIAFLASGLITIAGVQREYPAVLGISTNISIADLLENTNKKRQENGLVPLKLNEKLNHAAEGKAKNMFSLNYWAHVAPDGTTPWVFIKDSGYEYLYAGENLARGFSSGADVVDAWMKSPSHRENLLSPNYRDIGFAVDSGQLTGSETVLVVQMFGSPYAINDEELTEEPTAFTPPQITQAPAVVVQPSVFPTPTVVAKADIQQESADAGVAAIQNKPLLDTGTVKRNTAFFFLALIIFVLLLDAVIIERKQIVRAFSHNVDHILFLLFVLLAGILIGSGLVI